jgi:LCP family protein required for cell wall assembly
MRMSDSGEEPSEYDWLYSPGTARSDRRPPPSARSEEPDRSDRQPDDEPTRAVPPAPTGPPSDHPPAADPGATQAMPAVSADAGPDDAASDDLAAGVDAAGEDEVEHTQVIERPPDGPPELAPEPPQNPSFGGVYAAPPPSSANAQRYADQQRQGRAPAPSAPPPSARPPTNDTTPPSGGRRISRKWWIRGAVIVIVAWLIFLIVVPIWSWQHISKVDAQPAGTRPPDTPGTTYLLVGSDSREGLTKQQRGELGTGDAAGQRTDTIILLHVPSGDGPRLLLSIPRDSYVDIPGHGMNKINAAYSIGGPKLLVQTIEKATDFRVDDYIEVGFTGFVDIVDAVGGITVCPETSIDDPKAGHLKMKKGCQEVDGQTALDYSRSRAFPLGDITRAEHQREVITQVGKKAASWQTVVFPWRYWKVNHAAAESLQIGDNVGPIDLTRFAWAMAHTGGSDTKRCVVPYSSLGAQTPVGSAVIWDKKAANAVFEAVREDDTARIRCSAQGQ